MEKEDSTEAITALTRNIALLERRAQEVSRQFESLCVQTEVLKIDILERAVVNHAKSAARQLGYRSMRSGGRNLGVGLLAAFGGLVLGAAAHRNGLFALSYGMSVLNGAAQELGQSRWAVSIDRDLVVVPEDRIVAGRTWATLGSLAPCLKELREGAQSGERCGNLDSVIEKLKRLRSKLVYLSAVSRWVAVSQTGGAAT
jgi:hypothetical protein